MLLSLPALSAASAVVLPVSFEAGFFCAPEPVDSKTDRRAAQADRRAVVRSATSVAVLTETLGE